MKGHTKIILTNVETGEQEVHEDDNLITNALDKLINIEMAMNHAPNTRILPIATNALGGIMLFDNTLTEDVNNIHFPAEAHLVGYANTSVNTDDKFRGSWNSVESGKTMTGYTAVWDFGTAQANGTIKAVARTSVHGGAAPLYNFLGPERVATFNGAPTTDNTWYPLRYDGEYLYMLKGNSSAHVMRMARVKIPRLRMGAADYSNVGRTYEVVASWSTEVTNYTYDNGRYTQYVYADDPADYEDGHDGLIYCMFYGVYNRSGTSYPYDINYFTIPYAEGEGQYERTETVRLTTGLGYRTLDNENYMNRARRRGGHVYKGVLYRMRNARIFDIIPLNNIAAYRTIRVIEDGNPDYIDHMHWGYNPNGCIFFEVYHYTTSSYNHRHCVLYPDGVFIIPERSYNQYAMQNSSSLYTGMFNMDEDLTVWNYYDSDEECCNWEANYLGTINNLAAPITKTAAQTMKIVYTLTDVDEDSDDDDEDEDDT